MAEEETPPPVDTNPPKEPSKFITEAEKKAYETNTLSGVDVTAQDDEFLDPEGFQSEEHKATYMPADETGLDVTAP